jgi:hypothetical protein
VQVQEQRQGLEQGLEQEQMQEQVLPSFRSDLD